MTGAELIKAIEEHELKDAKLDGSAMADDIVFIEHDSEHDIYKETTIDILNGKVNSITYF